ncbi:hypothetical protein L4D09_07275 [Photobacterium makurazakiensis]|uniref:hypothetical protein n=1 Tax=Photobacterium makurazakiensis TaxID=2910234 RepID=UPI003D0D8E83
MRAICRFIIIIAFAWLPAIISHAATVDVALSHYSKATHLASLGRYEQASEQWHRLTIIFLSSEAKLGRKRMWQYAGLSEALAAVAADKANNADAYQYWADSTRYLMTGGTNWDQMRKKLHRRYERANTLLSTQLQVADLASSIDAEWQQELTTLQIWDEKLGLYRFKSPKLGLQDARDYQVPSNTQSAPIQKPVNVYQPRAGGKKLSGLNKTFSNEQQFVPVVEPTLEAVPDKVKEKNLELTQGAEAETQKLSTEKVEVIDTESSVTRHLIVTDAGSKLDTVPVMSKGIIIAPDARLAADEQLKKGPVKIVKVEEAVIEIDAIEVGAEDAVIATPIEALEFDEQAVVPVTTAEAIADPLDEKETTKLNESNTTIIPRANLDSSDSRGVEAIQRRSFAPVTEGQN